MLKPISYIASAQNRSVNSNKTQVINFRKCYSQETCYNFRYGASSPSLCYLLSRGFLCLLKADLMLGQQKHKTRSFSVCFLKIYGVLKICKNFYFILTEAGA